MSSLWKSVQKSETNKMLSVPIGKRESLSDELIERTEPFPDELIERRESLQDELIERGESLPDDLIEEILSWLPVKSVTMFNCVCKLFHTIIHDQKFIQKHMNHAHVDTSTTDEISATWDEAPLLTFSRINGLILERCNNPSRTYQIRNHATNRVLELPDPKENSISFSLRHISTTNEYKVLSVYWEGHSGIGMQVLTVGTDTTWRPIEIPIPFDRLKNGVTSRTERKGIINYIVEFSKPDLKQSKMIAFKLEDETFMEIMLPQELLFSSESEFWAIQWEQKISLICRIEGGFRIWVLDNVITSMWVENKLVFQTDAVSQDEDHLILSIARPKFFLQGQLYCDNGDKKMELICDTESRKIVYIGLTLARTIKNENTLVSFSGMH